MKTITVNLGARSYPVRVGAGALPDLGVMLRELGFEGRRAAVVTDAVVAGIYAPVATQALSRAGLHPFVVEVPAGEENKSLRCLASIYDRLIEGGMDRGSPVVALGGGVVGDMAGFAAATLFRGVPLVQVPTTLLAQVDASVGGKTGINHPAGKNLIGAFHQPRLVLIDTDTLKTLARRELVGGLAEVIKYGVILDRGLFELIEEGLPRLLDLEPALLGEVIGTCCQLKADVVARDETESGYRAILNFGHTLGHAVESATAYRAYLHGEAVSIGMAAAARISVRRRVCRPQVCERLVGLLARAGLPVEIPEAVAREELARAIAADKKRLADKIRFVLVEEIGRVRFERLGAPEILDCM